MTILGMLGGGQLGRMAALAASNLGIETHVFCPEQDTPAEQVTKLKTTADYLDFDALKHFAESVHCISYEFENIPVEAVTFLEGLRPTYPSSALLNVAQDRLKEKTAFQQFGLPVTRFAAAKNAADIESTLSAWGVGSAIVKTTRFGYDGKGQARVTAGQAQAAWDALKADVLIVEDIVLFDLEVSAIVARDQKGQVGCYDIGLNVHKNSILHTTTVPCGLPQLQEQQAKDLAIALAEKLNLVGVLGVELFVKGNQLLLNEIAPRPHNSGHWTMDACVCSQFEQQVRAVCGMNLGSFARHSNAVMLNLIGNDVVETGRYLHDPHAALHLYGKRAVKEGRKMGHVNFVKERKE